MNQDIFFGLIQNIAMLMALSVVYEVTYLIPKRRWRPRSITRGLMIGFIGITLMMIPFRLYDGIAFDTRTILVGVSAITFGALPAGIGAFIMAIYRILTGGAGVYMGVATIAVSLTVGVFWRNFIPPRLKKNRLISAYLCGVVIHLGMLACTVLLPDEIRLLTLKSIIAPVLLFYPLATTGLCFLLWRQQERNASTLNLLGAGGRYQSIFENNNVIMYFVKANNGDFIEVNEAASRFYGWSRETMKKMNIAEVNTLPYGEIKKRAAETLKEQKRYIQFKHRKASGEVVDVEVYSIPIVLDGENAIFTIVNDVSARIAVDKALEVSESRFQNLVEAAPIAIYIRDNKNFLYVNRAAMNLYGAQSKEQLIGTPVLDRIHPDYLELLPSDSENTNIDKISQLPQDCIDIKLDGTPVLVEATSVKLDMGNHSEAVVNFLTDVTELRQYEKDKLEMESQLRQQQKLEAVGTLASGVAHEINNPINGIINFAQLMLDNAHPDCTAKNYAKEIIRESEHISTIVKNLLQFSKQDKQSHSFASVYDIIDRTVSLTGILIKRDQIDFRIEIEKNLPPIKCRSQQIEQVVMNLLTNARDALNEKYPEQNSDKVIDLSCYSFEEEGHRWIRLAVKDHGNGIPEDIRDKIYEPFFSTKAKDKGTGLGLSISFGIVKEHGGRMLVETEAGTFTKIIVELPTDNGWSIGLPS